MVSNASDIAVSGVPAATAVANIFALAALFDAF